MVNDMENISDKDIPEHFYKKSVFKKKIVRGNNKTTNFRYINRNKKGV